MQMWGRWRNIGEGEEEEEREEEREREGEKQEEKEEESEREGERGGREGEEALRGPNNEAATHKPRKDALTKPTQPRPCLS